MQYSTSEFEKLYTRCFPPSLRLAMSLLHDEDEARDVVQEVFLKLWESDTAIDNPLAFVLRSIRNASITRIGKLDTREKILQRIALESPPDDYDIMQRNEEVAMAIQKLLAPRERQIVDRIYTDRMTYKETAEHLDISVSAVNKTIVSALRKLRLHFKTGKS